MPLLIYSSVKGLCSDPEPRCFKESDTIGDWAGEGIDPVPGSPVHRLDLRETASGT